MTSISGMQTLIRVVDTGSFSAAARQMDVAPSSVSRVINDLELELGISLFQRTTRKLNLTEAGQIYCEHTRKILAAMDEAKLAISQTGSPTGILRVTSPTAVGRELLISMIPAFLEAYPGIQVVMSLSDTVVDLVEMAIDVAVRVGPLGDSTLRARKLGDSRRVVCASEAYLIKHGTPQHPSELSNHQCLTFREHPGFNTWVFREKRKGKKKSQEPAQDLIKVKVTGNFFARSSDGIVAACLAGMGLILMPDWNMGIELQQKKLQVVLSDYELAPATTPIWALHTHQRQVPPKVRAFIDFMADHFAGAQYS